MIGGVDRLRKKEHPKFLSVGREKKNTPSFSVVVEMMFCVRHAPKAWDNNRSGGRLPRFDPPISIPTDHPDFDKCVSAIIADVSCQRRKRLVVVSSPFQRTLQTSNALISRFGRYASTVDLEIDYGVGEYLGNHAYFLKNMGGRWCDHHADFPKGIFPQHALTETFANAKARWRQSFGKWLRFAIDHDTVVIVVSHGIAIKTFFGGGCGGVHELQVLRYPVMAMAVTTVTEQPPQPAEKVEV